MPANNLITDVAGLSVGNAHDEKLRSGVTVLLCDKPMTAAIDVRGGGTGTRDTHALEYEGMVQQVHGLVLSGGSAFGLDAATGVQSFLREQGRGFAVGDARVPIVPQAILFDLLNGGDKDWGRRPPFQDMAFAACENARADFTLGTVGAGYGATTCNLKGGLGSASAITPGGITIGALAAVNAVGSVTVGGTPHFWAAPFESGAEYGGCGSPAKTPPGALTPHIKGGPGENTTLVIVACDASLDRLALKRLAIMAQSGLARAIYPAHTPLDGDIVFAVSTDKNPAPDPVQGLAELGARAANVTARAIARAVYEASAFSGEPKGLPAYKDIHTGNG
ncbi:MAG: P1 family peptidase [Alphaproteobacteria bacterium]